MAAGHWPSRPWEAAFTERVTFIFVNVITTVDHIITNIVHVITIVVQVIIIVIWFWQLTGFFTSGYFF